MKKKISMRKVIGICKIISVSVLVIGLIIKKSGNSFGTVVMLISIPFVVFVMVCNIVYLSINKHYQ